MQVNVIFFYNANCKVDACFYAKKSLLKIKNYISPKCCEIDKMTFTNIANYL